MHKNIWKIIFYSSTLFYKTSDSSVFINLRNFFHENAVSLKAAVFLRREKEWNKTLFPFIEYSAERGNITAYQE